MIMININPSKNTNFKCTLYTYICFDISLWLLQCISNASFFECFLDITSATVLLSFMKAASVMP